MQWNGIFKPDTMFKISGSEVSSCHCLRRVGSWAAVYRGPWGDKKFFASDGIIVDSDTWTDNFQKN